MSAVDDTAILAALLWDKPTLLQSPTPGARAFAEALGPPPHSQEVEGDDAPLAIAAHAIRLELSGDPEQALRHYTRLGAIEGWPSVLAGFLIAWSSIPVDGEVIDRVAQATRDLGIEDEYLRARLMLKLATYALDKGRGDLFAGLLNEAADAAPVGTPLRRAIRIVRLNFLDVRLDEEDLASPPEIDLLVDYPWIDDLALRAARAEVTSGLKARASSPWSWTIHAGRTPLDEVLAAERQATWAGALWLRDPVRQQLGAHMLVSGGDAYRTLYALTMWVLSGGGDVARVIDFSEPRFDEGTADALIGQVEAQTFISRIRSVALPKVAVALWDLLGSQTIDRLLGQLRPTPEALTVDPEVRHFWGRTALVVPEVWHQRARELEPSQQAALLEALPSAALVSLDPSLAEQFAAAGEEASDALSPAGRGALAVVQRNLGRDVSIGEGPEAVRVAAEVVLRDADVLPASEYEAAEQLLREQRRQEADEARQGSMGFGGRSTAGDLSLVAQARGAIDDESLRELVSEASDDQLPADFRLDSLMALSRLASTGLAAPELQRIDEPEHPHPMSFVMPMSIDLLRAARLAVHARRLDANEQVAVLILSRHSDPRVRQVAVAAAGMFLTGDSSASVEAALLAGLYDPDESVLGSALSALENARLTEITSDAVVQRLVRLYQGYGRGVREATVQAANIRLLASYDPRLSEIVDRAAEDRSWRVRRAATEDDVE